MGKPRHGGSSGTMLLKECQISMPGGKTISMDFEVGDILSFDSGDARCRKGWGHGVGQGMHKSLALQVALESRRWRA